LKEEKKIHAAEIAVFSGIGIPFLFEAKGGDAYCRTKKVQTERHRTGCAGGDRTFDDEIHCVIGAASWRALSESDRTSSGNLQ